MCTVTVAKRQGQRVLTMNRDEARVRGPELEPSWYGAVYGPRDSDAGGTWIGINKAGLSACLLNYCLGTPSRSLNKKSRGLIVPSVLEQETFSDAERFFLSQDFLDFDPFTFLLLDGLSAKSYTWRGEGEIVRTQYQSVPFILTSSSWNTLEAEAWRCAEFYKKDWGWDSETKMSNYHFYQSDDNYFASPFVDRPKSYTKSVTEVVWSENQLELSSYSEPMAMSLNC